MRKFIMTSLLIPAFLFGCASTPRDNSQISSLQQQIDQLDTNPEGKQYAPVAVRQAQESLDKLKTLANKDSKSDEYQHQLFVTEKQIEIARETINQKQAEEVVATAELRRKDILLQAEQQQSEQARSLAASMAGRAQALEQQVSDLQAQETDRGLVLTLGAVLFETGKATLQEGGRRTVTKIAEFLNQYPERNILIEGFTDSTGSEDFNQRLSEQRAEAVKELLVLNGVEANRIEVQGHGEAYPVASNENAAGRQQNRRVEIVIGKENGARVSDRADEF